MGHLEKYCEEIKESCEEQAKKIKSLGTIKEIVNNQYLLISILTYSGDRHLLRTFCDLLNEAIGNGEVLPEDLEFLRNGWFGNYVVNLDKLLENYGRKAYDFEKGDKLNYLSTIQDPETQIATYTNPKVISAIAEIISDRELSYCENSFPTLSIDAQLRVIEEVMKTGNMKKSIQLLSETNNVLAHNRKYSEVERRKDSGRK